MGTKELLWRRTFQIQAFLKENWFVRVRTTGEWRGKEDKETWIVVTYGRSQHMAFIM
jgi:hypothetical protein